MLVPADRRSEHAPPRAFVVVFEEIHMESTLALIAASWAIAMALGPILQIRKIVENRSSRTVSIGYFLVLLLGFILWVAYGIAASSFVLIVPKAVAAIVSSATILVALRYRQLPRSAWGGPRPLAALGTFPHAGPRQAPGPTRASRCTRSSRNLALGCGLPHR